MRSVIGVDSLGRKWRVDKDLRGNVELTPVGHATDPDSDDLSMDDETALCRRVEDDEAEERDPRWDAYDRRRDRDEERRMAA